MATILKGHKMVSKTKIENTLTEAYNHNSFEYLGLCDGGSDGQVVYVQAYAQKHRHNPQGARNRVYVFYGYDRYIAGKIDGQVVYDSRDEETWKEVFFDKASAVEFAQKIIKGEK